MAVCIVARYRFFRAIPYILGKQIRFRGLINSKTSILNFKILFYCNSLLVDQAEASEVRRVKFLAYLEKDKLFKVELVVIDTTTLFKLTLVEE